MVTTWFSRGTPPYSGKESRSGSFHEHSVSPLKEGVPEDAVLRETMTMCMWEGDWVGRLSRIVVVQVVDTTETENQDSRDHYRLVWVEGPR